jgi:orotate phosphoribosyltransferase
MCYLGFLSRVDHNMDSENEERNRLLSLIRERAVEIRKEGFILASGRTSNMYVDLRRITQDPEGINLIGRLVLSRIRELAPRAKCVGGLETGSIPIATAVSLLSLSSGNPPLKAFWVRKKLKDHGMQNLVEGNLEKGSEVVVLDDTVTTGGSTIQAIEAVRQFGSSVVQAISIVDRGGSDAFKKVAIPYYAFFSDEELTV